MAEQDKEAQLKSYMDRLPPPTQAELEALASYSSMFLGYALVGTILRESLKIVATCLTYICSYNYFDI